MLSEHDNNPVVDRWGRKRWYVNGEFHRDGDLPAEEYANGTKCWWVNGERHRDGGLPAFVSSDGEKCWCVKDKDATHLKSHQWATTNATKKSLLFFSILNEDCLWGLMVFYWKSKKC